SQPAPAARCGPVRPRQTRRAGDRRMRSRGLHGSRRKCRPTWSRGRTGSRQSPDPTATDPACARADRKPARMEWDRPCDRPWVGSSPADCREVEAAGKICIPDFNRDPVRLLKWKPTIHHLPSLTLKFMPNATARTKGPLVFLDMDQQALDDAYDQEIYAPNRALIVDRRKAASARARAILGAPKRVAY